MSIKSDLSILKVNIQNAKDKLYTNLVDKGVTDITTASTLTEMADSVSGITNGGGSIGVDSRWLELGYDGEPTAIQKNIDIAKDIKNNWDNTITNCSGKYRYKSLLFFPTVDTSNVTDMSSMFEECRCLTKIGDINTSKVTNMKQMFSYCISLTSLDLSNFDTSNVTDMSYMFYQSSGLTSLDVSSFNTSKVTKMNNMFQRCSGLTSLVLSNFDTSNVTNMSSIYCNLNENLKIIGSLSLKNCKERFLGYYQGTSLRRFILKDLGTLETVTNMDFNNCYKWGINNEIITDARQSLVDSLLTYSFDRATAGYSTFTVTLSANSKAVLTEDEIAQITAKGFTIA